MQLSWDLPTVKVATYNSQLFHSQTIQCMEANALISPLVYFDFFVDLTLVCILIESCFGHQQSQFIKHTGYIIVKWPLCTLELLDSGWKFAEVVQKLDIKISTAFCLWRVPSLMATGWYKTHPLASTTVHPVFPHSWLAHIQGKMNAFQNETSLWHLGSREVAEAKNNRWLWYRIPEIMTVMGRCYLGSDIQSCSKVKLKTETCLLLKR